MQEICRTHRTNGAVIFLSDGDQILMQELGGEPRPLNMTRLEELHANAYSDAERTGIEAIFEIGFDC